MDKWHKYKYELLKLVSVSMNFNYLLELSLLAICRRVGISGESLSSKRYKGGFWSVGKYNCRHGVANSLSSYSFHSHSGSLCNI